MRKSAYLIVCLLAACTGLRAAPVAGVLTDLNAKPLEGVKVYSFLIGATETKLCTPKTEASAVTDSDGRYSLGDLPDLTGNQCRYTVAYLPGKYIGWTMQSPDMAEMERYVGKPRPLTVVPAVLKKGRVVDEKGRPLAKVPVKYLGLSVQQGYPMFLPAEILEILHIPTNLTSSSDGAYTIADAASDAEVFVVPREKGFAARNSYIDPANLKIVLVPAGHIKGLVKDTTGKPLQGVEVSAFQMNCSNNSATTDAHGRFVLSDLSPGTWYVSAHKRGRIFTTTRDVSVKAAKTTLIPTISELPAASVSGEVVYADTGKPAEGISVIVSSMDLRGTSGPALPTTDASGAFKTEAPVGKNYVAVTTLPIGYIAEERSRFINVPKTGISGLKIKLVKASVGKGRVVDGTGQPVAGASVSFFIGGETSAQTGLDGSFTLTLPCPDPEDDYSPFGGATLALCVLQKERKLGAIKLVSRDDLLQDKVSIAVGPVARIKVHVTLPSNKPAAGAKLSKVTAVSAGSRSSSYSDYSEMRTDANGNVEVDDLMPGARYEIVASLPGYFDAGQRPHIEPGTTVTEVINIKLEPAARVQKGKVIDEKGKPVAGAEVRAEGRGMQTITSTKTDATGHFTLRGLPDSKVRLDVNKSNRYGGMTVSKSSGTIILQITPQDF